MRAKIDRDRIETLFHQALQLAPGSRRRFLDLECGSDPSLCNEVLSLLAHYESAELTLGNPLVPPDALLAALSQQSNSRLEPGKLLASRFRLVRCLASGGMGDVYEAEDTQLGERVALKTIRGDIAANPRMLARFKQEVQLAKRVSHPNVCRIHDLGIDERPSGSLLFLTMELLQGETLDQCIERKPMTLREVQAIASQVAAGLDAAHAARVVHRDLKGNNVMLTPGEDSQPRAVITDFGIAHAAHGEASDTLTKTGEIVGTLDYMAPEQLLGQPATPVTDVYAFGVLLFHMVTRGLPFSGQKFERSTLDRLKGPPPSLRSYVPDLPRQWERVIQRCMDVNPSARFQSAGEVIKSLEAGNLSRRIAIPKFSGARRRHLGLLAAVVLVASALGFWVISLQRSPNISSQPLSKVPDASTAQDARIHYQRGMYFWNLRTQDAFVKAIEEFKSAIQADPQFGAAHAGLAWVYAMQSGFKPPREVFPEAKKSAETAIKLDGNGASGHAVLAFVRFYYDWDWQSAEDEFKRAIQLDPGYAPAHSNYAMLLSVQRRFDEAIHQAKLAEQADPVSAAVATGIGRVYYWSGKYREAVQQFQRVLSMYPQFPEAHLSMATALQASGNADAAVRQISYVLSDSLSSSAIADLAHIYARTGEAQLARSMVLKLENLRNENKRYVSPCHLAVAYAALGDRDQAFNMLGQALKERTFEMVYLGLNPEYASLRQDERWVRLVRKVGLAS